MRCIAASGSSIRILAKGADIFSLSTACRESSYCVYLKLKHAVKSAQVAIRWSAARTGFNRFAVSLTIQAGRFRLMFLLDTNVISER
jgi:hypothetical protein